MIQMTQIIELQLSLVWVRLGAFVRATANFELPLCHCSLHCSLRVPPIIVRRHAPLCSGDPGGPTPPLTQFTSQDRASSRKRRLEERRRKKSRSHKEERAVIAGMLCLRLRLLSCCEGLEPKYPRKWSLKCLKNAPNTPRKCPRTPLNCPKCPKKCTKNSPNEPLNSLGSLLKGPWHVWWHVYWHVLWHVY